MRSGSVAFYSLINTCIENKPCEMNFLKITMVFFSALLSCESVAVLHPACHGPGSTQSPVGCVDPGRG